MFSNLSDRTQIVQAGEWPVFFQDFTGLVEPQDYFALHNDIDLWVSNHPGIRRYCGVYIDYVRDPVIFESAVKKLIRYAQLQRIIWRM